MPTYEVEVRYIKVDLYIVEAKDAEEAKEKYTPDDFGHTLEGEKEVWGVTKIDTLEEETNE